MSDWTDWIKSLEICMNCRYFLDHCDEEVVERESRNPDNVIASTISCCSCCAIHKKSHYLVLTRGMMACEFFENKHNYNASRKSIREKINKFLRRL